MQAVKQANFFKCLLYITTSNNPVVIPVDVNRKAICLTLALSIKKSDGQRAYSKSLSRLES